MELAGGELMEYLKRCIALEAALAERERTGRELRAVHSGSRPMLLLERKRYVERARLPGYFGWGILFAMLAAFCVLLLLFPAGDIKRLGVAGMAAIAALSALSLFIIVRALIVRGREHASYKRAEEFNEHISAVNRQKTARYQAEMAWWQRVDNSAQALINERQSETREALRELYAIDAVEPKYRTLPALTSIYEYLLSGRCDKLAGPAGAYEIYEDEAQKGIVVTRLDAAFENPERVKANQHMLYEILSGIAENSEKNAARALSEAAKGCDASALPESGGY